MKDKLNEKEKVIIDVMASLIDTSKDMSSRVEDALNIIFKNDKSYYNKAKLKNANDIIQKQLSIINDLELNEVGVK